MARAEAWLSLLAMAVAVWARAAPFEWLRATRVRVFWEALWSLKAAEVVLLRAAATRLSLRDGAKGRVRVALLFSRLGLRLKDPLVMSLFRRVAFLP